MLKIFFKVSTFLMSLFSVFHQKCWYNQNWCKFQYRVLHFQSNSKALWSERQTSWSKKQNVAADV